MPRGKRPDNNMMKVRMSARRAAAERPDLTVCCTVHVASYYACVIRLPMAPAQCFP